MFLLFVAAQDPLLPERTNATLSFVDVIVGPGSKHRCVREADSITGGEKNSTSVVGHSVVKHTDHMGCFLSAPAISQRH